MLDIWQRYFNQDNRRFDVIPIEYKPIIEKAIGFTLYNHQSNYLFNDNRNLPMGRCNGKTLAYAIRIILCYKHLPLKHNRHFTDGIHGGNYDRWFRHYFLQLREQLKQAGLPVKLLLRFKDKPECSRCMLSEVGYRIMDNKSIRHCVATGDHPTCPEEGCRKDCPLVEESEVSK